MKLPQMERLNTIPRHGMLQCSLCKMGLSRFEMGIRSHLRITHKLTSKQSLEETLRLLKEQEKS